MCIKKKSYLTFVCKLQSLKQTLDVSVKRVKTPLCIHGGEAINQATGKLTGDIWISESVPNMYHSLIAVETQTDIISVGFVFLIYDYDYSVAHSNLSVSTVTCGVTVLVKSCEPHVKLVFGNDIKNASLILEGK